MKRSYPGHSKQTTFSETRTTDWASNKFLSFDMNNGSPRNRAQGGQSLPPKTSAMQHTPTWGGGPRRQRQYYAQFNQLKQPSLQ